MQSRPKLPGDTAEIVSTEQGRRSRMGDGARLAATMMSGSLVQFSIGALAPFILVDLDISRARLGVLISGYYLVGALTSPLFGRLTGRVGGTGGLKLVSGLGIGACLSIAAAHSQVLFCVGLLLGGLAVAAANPATNLAIAELPPPHGVLVGVKQSGVQLAGVLAGSLMPLIARLYGWRTSFAVAGAVGVLVLGTVAWSSRPGRGPVRRPDDDARAAGNSTGVGVLACYAFLMGIGTATVGVYLALFTHERLAVSPQVAGAVVAVMGLAAVIARIGWNVIIESGRGPLSDERVALRVIALVAMSATGVIVLSGWWGAGLVWVGALAMGASAAAWNGVAMLSLVRSSTGARSLGQASGRVQGAFFVGMACGPPVFGLIVDSTGRYAFGWLWTAASFVGAFLAVAFLTGVSGRSGKRQFADRAQ